MTNILRWLLLGSLLVAGCAHAYVYSGSITEKDSQGKTREHLLYWNRTERPLWFKSDQGPFVTILQCNKNNLAYDERPDGIVFRARPDDKKVIGEEEKNINDRVCGRILDVTRIAELSEGKVRVTVLCKDDPVDELSISKPYLQPQDQPYTFMVTKQEVPDYSAPNIPVLSPCDNP